MTPPERRTRVLGLLSLLATYLLPVVLFAAIEVGLRAAGVAEDDPRRSRLAYQQISVPILHAAERPDGTPIYQVTDSRLPYQSIARDKPEDGLRVFIFGGSATAGLGFGPNATFARELERMLVLAYPDRSVELVNLGIVALASAQVDLLVEDVVRSYEPDLLVVYSGNNEFLEIHARKFADAQASAWSRTVEFVLNLRLAKLIRRATGRDVQKPSDEEKELSHEDLRLTQDAIIQSIEMRPEETDAVVDRYEHNLRHMLETAESAEVPILLVTVATNWRWRGRSDLPDDWLETDLGEPADSPEALARARDRIGDEIAKADPKALSEWLFKRALLSERLGDLEGARRDYRAAMNADPHQRRALDRMADRLRSLASESGAAMADAIEALAATDADGIVGFEAFYDYVHFTPVGNLPVASEIYRVALARGLLPEGSQLPIPELEGYRVARRRRLEGAVEDALAVGDWLGFGFDPAGISDRDLWKYDRLQEELDRRLAADPDDLVARVYRGNLRSFRVDGAEEAAQDYREALERAPGHPVVRDNLERLRFERGL